jgi:hypothetical protein
MCGSRRACSQITASHRRHIGGRLLYAGERQHCRALPEMLSFDAHLHVVAMNEARLSVFTPLFSVIVIDRRGASKQNRARRLTRMATTKKSAAKGGADKTKAAAAEKPKSGGKGLAAEVQPSADLAAIIGSTPMPRSQVTKKVWDYIKEKGLQDSANRRMINADDHLKKIFNGKKQVSMFEMTSLVNKHLS